MNPLRAYQAYQKQQDNAPFGTRIDMLLSLFNGAIERTRTGLELLKQNQSNDARNYFMKAQMIVLGLASGINPEAGDPSSANLMRLYEYAAHCLTTTDPKILESAVTVLSDLRDGFQGIRLEAVRLERTGQLPPLEEPRLLEATG